MKKTIIALLLLLPVICAAQTQTARVGGKVKQTYIRNSSNEPVPLPEFGKKHLLIFYVDPDHWKQNKDFTDYMEDNHIISDHIHGFGIVNLKDAPLFPNAVLRPLIRMKEKNNDVVIYTDPEHLLRDAWGLGDCNNQFVILFVTKQGEIAYFSKGRLTEADKKEFFRVIDKYK